MVSATAKLACVLLPYLTHASDVSKATRERAEGFFVGKAPISGQFDAGRLRRNEEGKFPSLEYKLFFEYDGAPISPWHDIPLDAGRGSGDRALFHFICEIPRGTTAKMEVNKEVAWNPIIQDLKKGKLRYYKYKPEQGSVVNYGALMQTWEHPDVPDGHTGVGGDNDPIDVLQLNSEPCERGELQRVRLLGALALVDGGETDWKLLVLHEDDQQSPAWQNVTDVPVGRVSELREWFRNYKTAEGKGQNKFGLGERAVGAEVAEQVAQEAHEHWKTLQLFPTRKNIKTEL